MHGLPKTFNSTVFVGAELEEVCFTVNTIHLIFTKSIAITLEGAFALAVRSDEQPERAVVPVASSRMMSLVGDVVISSERAGDGSLLLKFKEGSTLICIDDSSEYESFRIRIGETETVV